MNCQFNFGVFTKWDKVLRDEEEGKRQQLQEIIEGDFQSLVNGKCMVYFVDAKYVTKEKVRFVQIIFSPSDQLPETWKRDKSRYWTVL